MTARGVSCKVAVNNDGDRCRFHRDVVTAENERIPEEEHQHHDNDSECSQSAPHSHTSQDATNEVLSKLLDKISLLEAEINKAKILSQSKPKPNVAKAKLSTEGKKKRAMTPAGAAVSARWIFYNEHKTDADILATVRGGLMKGNMLVKKTQIVNGVTIEKEVIPYTLVKIATDMKYEQLSQEEMESYLLEAYERNDAKYA